MNKNILIRNTQFTPAVNWSQPCTISESSSQCSRSRDIGLLWICTPETQTT